MIDHAQALRALHDVLLACGNDYSDVLLDAASHIELLQGYRDEAEAAASIAHLAADSVLARNKRLQLTAAERAAIESAIKDDEAATAFNRADILRNFLERTNESDQHG